MKVVLVHPRFPNNSYKVPPLGIACLAAYLRIYCPDNTNVQVIDSNALDLTIQETFERVKAANPDILGMSIMTPQADFAYSLTKLVKEWNTKTVVVHGGVHVTAMPYLSLRSGANYCVIGEGEATFAELLNWLAEGGQPIKTVAGLALLKDSEIVYTPTRPLIRNLDEIPFPAWDIFELSLYNENIHVSTEYALPIMGSRGCPFNCSFCASPIMWSRRVRFRSPANVVTEMVRATANYGITHFHFYDDNLLLKRDWVIRLCREIAKRDLSWNWICLSRAADINRNTDILSALKSAGCCGFEIGVESGDENVLNEINKDQYLTEIEDAFLNVAKKGFEYLGIQLMTFNVGETVQGHNNQSKFFDGLFHALREHSIQLSPESNFPYFGQFATPYPGTPFYQSASRTGICLAKTWSDYITTRVNYIPNSLLKQPVHLTSKLDAEMREILWEINKQYIFSNSYEQSASILTDMLDLFINLLEKDIALEEMATIIMLQFNISEYTAMKFSSINLVAVSQMGIIQTSQGS